MTCIWFRNTCRCGDESKKKVCEYEWHTDTQTHRHTDTQAHRLIGVKPLTLVNKHEWQSYR